MATPYTDSLRGTVGLSASERAVFDAVPVNSAEELLSLLWNFPSLGELGVDAAKLSSFAAPQAPSFVGAMADEGLTPDAPRAFALGSAQPEEAVTRLGSTPELRDVALPPVDDPGEAIDKRLGMLWPVRDQGGRGTCVAFAVTALREHLFHEMTGAIPDLSEQFLFWATKTTSGDPQPTADGTWIRFALRALNVPGICQESDWPYNGTPIMGNVTHQGPNAPSARARTNAAAGSHAAAFFATGVPGTGKATVLGQLRQCRPVAVSLPVFADPLRPAGHNWNSPVGVLYGKVLDPPPTAVVTGGHAVCVTGFVPDANELSGGHFVFRNSWNVTWGSRLPNASYHGPQPGYGQVSASYVNKYLWEAAQL